MTEWQAEPTTLQPATREELDRALPFIAAAPKDDAPIDMLCLRPAFGERRFVTRIDVTRDQGIPGERWATHPWLRLADGRPHPGIQVCILSRRVLDLVWRDRAGTVHPGDTFVVDMDLSEANLPTGQRLRAGSAVLEVSDIFNDACVKWKTRYGAPTQEWVRAPGNRPLRLRGILCRVAVDGVITMGDRLTKA